jgi:RimJ/RimL family protein N-acetyltransferase
VKVEPALEIATERLLLSRIARADTGDLVAMLVNPVLYQYIGEPPTAEDAAARVGRWLRGSPDPGVLWINYVARHDGAFVGLAQATVWRADQSRFGTCEIAYLVDPPAQRHGYGTEMMRGFCAELTGTLAPAELTAHIHPGHVASERIARAVGLVPTGELVDDERVWRGLR